MISFGTSFYKFVQPRAGWKIALEWCKENGGHLVIIESAEEDEFIAELTENKPVLIGARYDKNRKAWFWVNGARFKYDNLNTQPQPIRYGDAVCLIKNRVFDENLGGGGKWYRAYPKGNTAQGFICEWD